MQRPYHENVLRQPCQLPMFLQGRWVQPLVLLPCHTRCCRRLWAQQSSSVAAPRSFWASQHHPAHQHELMPIDQATNQAINQAINQSLYIACPEDSSKESTDNDWEYWYRLSTTCSTCITAAIIYLLPCTVTCADRRRSMQMTVHVVAAGHNAYPTACFFPPPRNCF